MFRKKLAAPHTFKFASDGICTRRFCCARKLMTAHVQTANQSPPFQASDTMTAPRTESKLRRNNSISENLGTFFNFSILKSRIARKSFSQNDLSQIEINPCSNIRVTSGEMSTTDTNLITSDCNEPAVWSGWLLKRSRGPLGAWQPRWFELRKRHPADCGVGCDQTGRSAVLICRSDSKGERQILVDDVRREHHLDSGLRTAFSVCVAEDDAKSPGKGKGGRVVLMAETDLEAVGFLSCLRSILEPDRVWPTLCEAIHYPANALRDLEGRRSV